MTSGVQRDALQDIGDVLAAVGAGFKPFVDLFPLDHRHWIGLFLKQLGDGIPGNPVGLILKAVDLNAAFLDVRVRQPQPVDAGTDGDGRLIQHVGELDRSFRWLNHLIEHKPVGDRFRDVKDIVQRARQIVDVLAVDRGDECLIEPQDDVMRDAVSDVLDLLDTLGLLDRRLVMLHHVLQEAAAFDHVVSGALEQFEERFFSRN